MASWWLSTRGEDDDGATSPPLSTADEESDGEYELLAVIPKLHHLRLRGSGESVTADNVLNDTSSSTCADDFVIVHFTPISHPSQISPVIDTTTALEVLTETSDVPDYGPFSTVSSEPVAVTKQSILQPESSYPISSIVSGRYKLICQVKMTGGDLGPPIQIDCQLIDARTKEVIRYAGAQFHREGSGVKRAARMIYGARLIQISHEHRSLTLVQFKHTNALVYGTQSLHQAWPDAIKNRIKELDKFCLDGHTVLELDSRLTHFKGPGSVDSGAHLFQFQDYKVTVDGQTRLLLIWQELLQAYRAPKRLQKLARISLPATYCFSSPEEANVRLVHATFAEYLLEQKAADEVCDGKFRVCFVNTRHKNVLAFVRTDGKTDPKLQMALAEHSLLNIELIGHGASEAGSGVTTTLDPDDKQKYDCKFALLIAKKNVSALIRQISSQRGAKPEFRFARLAVKGYELARIQVGAMNRFFDRHGRFENWWPVFLGGGSHGMTQPNNFLIHKLGYSQLEIDAVVDETVRKAVLTGLTFNTEQKAYLSRLGQSCGGWSLVRGPPGTGKTTLLAWYIHALLQFEGVSVFASAGSNGAVNRLFSCVQSVMQAAGIKDLERQPMRVCRKYTEQDYFFSQLGIKDGCSNKLKTQEPTRNPESAESAMDYDADDWYKRFADAEEERLGGHAQYGLMAAVLQAIRTRDLREIPAARQDFADQDGKLGVQCQQYRDAEETMSELYQMVKKKAYTGKGAGIWAAVRHIKNQILGTRRLVVSTTNNATTLLVREAVFRDATAVVVITDEGALSTDPELVTLLSGMINNTRVQTEFEGKSPIEMMLLAGDEYQGAPLVLSKEKQVNRFGAQLALSTFERLVKIGVPVHALYEQHRMTPLIREFPSERCYDGKLRDSEVAARRTLTDCQKTQVTQILRTLSPATSDVHQIDQEDLQHVLINTANSYHEADERKSLFNDVNVKATMNLVTQLLTKKVVEPRDFVILTLYNAQKQRYVQKLQKLERTLGLKDKGLIDNVFTSDEFQGRERDCVIFDPVVCFCPDPPRQGNAWDERRLNVACTRARTMFFVVANVKILRTHWEKGYDRAPYLVELLERLKENRAVVKYEASKK